MKKLVLIAMSMKGLIAAMIILLVCGQRLLSQSWFNPNVVSLSQLESDIKKAPDVDVRKDGMTGLMAAAVRGDLRLVKLLIENGARVNAQAEGRVLLENLQGLKLYRGSDDQTGFTPLHYAVLGASAKKNTEVINFLLENGADVNARDGSNSTPMYYVLFDRTVQDQDKIITLIDLLVKNGADINAQGKDGNTIAHLVVDANLPRVMEYLKTNYGTLINFELQNSFGLSPKALALQLRTSQSMIDQMEDLPEKFGLESVTQRDSGGRTGLMLAVARGDLSFASDQISRGADVNAQAKDGNTALHYASSAQRDPVRLVELLLNKDAKPTIANDNGDTPLLLITRLAKSEDRQKVAKLLINAGASLFKQNKNGDTILHLAVKEKDNALLRFLKDQFGSVIENNQDMTPVELARQLGNTDALLILQ